jgi:hypothetical protein
MLYSVCKGTIIFRNGNIINERKTKFPLVFRSILCNFAPEIIKGCRQLAAEMIPS